jgi:hypothetical protein
MRILIANGWIGGRSGSEVHTKDLAMCLHQRGHACTVYVGVIKKEDADVLELRGSGVKVITRPEEAETPDIIIGHHRRETMRACLAHPRTPAIQICHDATHERDRAVGPEVAQAWGAVDAFCQERLVRETGLSPDDIFLTFNPVDLRLFPSRTTPPPTPPRRGVLFYSDAATPSILTTVREACEHEGVALDAIGPGRRFVDEPGRVLAGYDVVFGKARCAIEAMASGAHVILCAPEGIGPLVTPDNFHALRRRNFGRSLLTEPAESELLRTRLRGLDTDATAELTKLVRRHNCTERLAEHLEPRLLQLAAQQTDRSVLRIRLGLAGLKLADYCRRRAPKWLGLRATR